MIEQGRHLLRVGEVADRVGLSEWAVRRAIHDGQLAAYKIRGQLRIDRPDLDDWLEGCRVTPTIRPQPAHVSPLTPSPSYPEGGSFRSRTRRREAS